MNLYSVLNRTKNNQAAATSPETEGLDANADFQSRFEFLAELNRPAPKVTIPAFRNNQEAADFWFAQACRFERINPQAKNIAFSANNPHAVMFNFYRQKCASPAQIKTAQAVAH
jgi:hypothetical protein